MHHFNFITIGSGIAGLNFALRAAEQKKRVLIITKKRVAEASTNFAQGGIATVLSKLDSFQKHVQDTLVAGAFHNTKRAVEYMVRHSPLAINRLIELGVPFATQEGSLLLTREGGHSERRIAFVSDFTGQAIEKVLVEKVRRNSCITLLEHTFAVDLLVKNNVCYGVQVIRQQGFKNVYGEITVLATGGVGQLYEKTTNPEISTGDGLAMAFRAGCSFRDLEFVQFHPTSFIGSAFLTREPTRAALVGHRARAVRSHPIDQHNAASQQFLISEAVRGEGAYLVNNRGERFMKKYHKLAELAPRDIVSRAIFDEEKHGPVFLDLRHKNSAYVKTRFPQIYQTLKKYGIDMTKDLIHISPAAHYLCGGIKVNLKGETGIQNLYAFGEVAGTGVHGANRLASNSLLEALVFSDRIIRVARPKKQKRIPFFRILLSHKASLREMRIGRNIKKLLKKTMWECVGIVRSKKSLNQALHTIALLQKKAHMLKANEPEILELKNMLLAAELITKAAIKRKKSLGCHYRMD